MRTSSSSSHPYRHSLTVCAECMFGWYWLADACAEEGITFVLAHALYLHLIHGGKNKNDRIDSEKIAHLLRSNLIPPSYVYPAAKRPLRARLKSTKNWSSGPHRSSRLHFECKASGFTAVSFWTAPKPSGLEDQMRFTSVAPGANPKSRRMFDTFPART